jgi:hypothetical protein
MNIELSAIRKWANNRWPNWIKAIPRFIIFIIQMALDSALSPKLEHSMSSAMSNQNPDVANVQI